MKLFTFFLLIFSFLQGDVVYKTNHYKVEELANSGTIIWSLEQLDSKKIIFAEKRGKVGVLDLVTKEVTYLRGVPTLSTQGQGGLMDIAVYKDKLFFTHLKRVDSEAVTTLSSAKLNKNTLSNWKEILVALSATDTGRHFGSRITFDENGHLFFSIGDRGVRPNGQNIKNHAGSIIRLNMDGSVPKDNPFVGKAGLDEIYSYGHRNPQGLFYDKKRKQLFSNEHGPRGGDEINYIEKGKNYGWAEISYGKEYWNPMYVGDFKRKGMEQPLYQFTPSIAPSSLLIYNGDMFPQWRGKFFSGALAKRHINITTFDKNLKFIKEERVLEDLGLRIRDIIEANDGSILFSTDNGKIFRISN